MSTIRKPKYQKFNKKFLELVVYFWIQISYRLTVTPCISLYLVRNFHFRRLGSANTDQISSNFRLTKRISKEIPHYHVLSQKWQRHISALLTHLGNGFWNEKGLGHRQGLYKDAETISYSAFIGSAVCPACYVSADSLYLNKCLLMNRQNVYSFFVHSYWGVHPDSNSLWSVR